MPKPDESLGNNGVATLVPTEVYSGDESLPVKRCLQVYRIMVRSRAMEERMIKMSKSGEGYFWIGGPGEEAFTTCLGLQVKKGHGLDYDYLLLHYRNSATMIAMGMELIDGIRQMAMTVTDPHSRGRNFPSHYARREWNVLPIASVIEVRHTMAPGVALMQKRHGGDGITIVSGGDAGTAEGDFASCLIWSSLPCREVPLLIVVQNNGWGISTPCDAMHAEKRIIDRGKAFGIPGEVVDGNDPIASWHAIGRAMAYCRRERRPFLLEARVSRLYGHSSSSGALRVKGEPDCIKLFEQKLLDVGVLDQEEIDRVRDDAREEAEQALEKALGEPKPTAADVEKHTYAASPVDVVYPDDLRAARNVHGAAWPHSYRRCGWHCTTPRSTSASRTSSARTSARPWAAFSRPRRGCRRRGTRRWTSAASSAWRWASPTPAGSRSPRSSSATTASTPSTSSRSPATSAGRATVTTTCPSWS
jgi:2-oxoisovalerate dehydrogenase E1 component alpha subunit